MNDFFAANDVYPGEYVRTLRMKRLRDVECINRIVDRLRRVNVLDPVRNDIMEIIRRWKREGR